jgi:hypothetical protein
VCVTTVTAVSDVGASCVNNGNVVVPVIVNPSLMFNLPLLLVDELSIVSIKSVMYSCIN